MVREVLINAKLVAEAHCDAGLAEQRLGPGKRNEVFLQIRDTLGVDLFRTHWPWDRRGPPHNKSLRCERAALLIPPFVGAEPCLLFTDEQDEIWRFDNGRDLDAFLEEYDLGEIYVCDEAGSYLICENHHDYLIGWGRAKGWVKELAGMLEADKTIGGNPRDPATFAARHRIAR